LLSPSFRPPLVERRLVGVFRTVVSEMLRNPT
jgi:hypothetical protein